MEEKIHPPLLTLIFDLDNTVYPSSSPMAAELTRRIGSFVEQEYGLAPSEAHAVRKEGFLRHGTTLKWMQQERGFADDDRFLEFVHPENVHDFLDTDPHLAELLRSLPYRKVILTNSTIEHAERVLRHFGVYYCFERIFDIRFNRHEGKPHREAYLRVMHELEQQPGQTLLIDDVPAYLDGFAAIGGRCLLMDETGRHPDSLHPKIQNLHQLPAFLSKL